MSEHTAVHDDQVDTTIEDAVAAAVGELLCLDEVVTTRTDFFDVGGDSIVGAQLVARLRQMFGVRITMRDVFTARTVGAIAASVRRRLDTSTRHR